MKEAGTAGATVPTTAATATSYAGADGGAYVAFAVPRAALTAAGITLGAPMVIGTTSRDRRALCESGLCWRPAKADVLGIGKAGLGTPGWSTLVTDPLDFDSDGDGVADNLDNCPVDANPGQEDDDAALDNSLPAGPDALRTAPRDTATSATRPRAARTTTGTASGCMDDQCGEQYGLQQRLPRPVDTTARSCATARGRSSSTARSRADYDQCVPAPLVTVFKVVRGPDKRIGHGQDRADRRLRAEARGAANGKYYAQVDPKWTLGARCFGVKSPKIQVR